MNRRKAIAILGGAAIGWPLAARAQQKAMRVIGFLDLAPSDRSGPMSGPFGQGLGETGYVGGQNYTAERRYADGHPDRLPALAADLVSRKVDVIVTVGGDFPARAAKNATSTIPIVFSTGSDPVQAGLVASFARPGGNLTGFSIMALELVDRL